MEKGRITWPQLCMLMYLAVGSTSVLIIPAITSKFAGNDLWISPIIGSSTGFLTMFLLLKLHHYYPEQTIIQYGERLLGRWIGGAANLVWLFFLWHGAGLIVREYGEFIVGSVLLRTPEFVVSICLTFVCAVAIRGGIEVLGKFSLLIAPLFAGFIFLTPVLLLPELDVRHITPVLEKGWKPVFEGAVTPLVWFMEFALIGFVIPYATGKRNKWRWTIISIVLMLVTMLVTNLTCLFLFGNLTSLFTFPIFVASRYISLGNFFEHVEAIVMVLWVMSGFVQMAVWYYALVIGTAQCFKLSDYRPLVFPIGILIIAMSFWIADSIQEMNDLFMTSEPLFSGTVQIVYPALLLLLAWWKHKRNGGQDVKNRSSAS
ncbi:GerAB/ArcD/ProY family transporter [Paenibacillus sp. OSY-SE]|uniref:GerAB/ArcD/ProY family transporter n=1 Tax=Paenibacillus sp. OSY-SE TaxID=1196323 RepID=UPI0002D4E35D|nr:endospore germination permease [Paenibacillus sp. OSY-SE]